MTVWRKNPPPVSALRTARRATVLGEEPHEGSERCCQGVGLAGVGGRHQQEGAKDHAAVTFRFADGGVEPGPGEGQAEHIHPRERRPVQDERHGQEGEATGHGRNPVPCQRV